MVYIKLIIGVIYFGNIVAWNPLIKTSCYKIQSILCSDQYTERKTINKSNYSFYLDRNDRDFIFLNRI